MHILKKTTLNCNQLIGQQHFIMSTNQTKSTQYLNNTMYVHNENDISVQSQNVHHCSQFDTRLQTENTHEWVRILAAAHMLRSVLHYSTPPAPLFTFFKSNVRQISIRICLSEYVMFVSICFLYNCFHKRKSILLIFCHPDNCFTLFSLFHKTKRMSPITKHKVNLSNYYIRENIH